MKEQPMMSRIRARQAKRDRATFKAVYVFALLLTVVSTVVGVI